ncbi:MAG: LexA family protein [Salinivenus sp.]
MSTPRPASPRGSSPASRVKAASESVVVTAVRRARGGPGRRRPVFLTRVEAGFPSPASDYVETCLALDDHLIDHEAATYFLRVSGSSMREAGIHDGDLLVVDRAVEPADGHVVVAALDGELTVKRLRVCDGRAVLAPENAEHEPIPIGEQQDLVVWGVVQHAIHEVS